MLRDHPSVIAFYQGSDDEPDPAKEALYLAAFRRADWQVPQIASAEYKELARGSARLARRRGRTTGHHLRTGGTPAARWTWAAPSRMPAARSGSIPRRARASRCRRGTRSTGSSRRADQRQLWDVRSVGGPHAGPDIFHASPYSGYTAIGRLGQYNTALWHRYGHWSGLASYEREAQAAGYEVTRAQFEAYIGQANDHANPSTGLIYWQLNKAWPSMQWQLYGYDFDQAGVYFGAKKANESVHIMYAYSDGSIRVSNLTNAPQRGLHARVEFRLDRRRHGRSRAPGGAAAAGPGRADRAPARGSAGHVLDVLPRARR